MHNWIPKNKIVRFAQGLALFSMVLYFVGLVFVMIEIKKVEDFYQGTESDSFKEKRFMAINSVMENNKESIQTLRNFFIQKGDEVEFIEQIEEVARVSGIKLAINSIDVKNTQSDSYNEEVGVKMKIEGSWSSVIYFIESLNKMPFGVLIEKTSIDSSKGEWSGMVDIIIFRAK